MNLMRMPEAVPDTPPRPRLSLCPPPHDVSPSAVDRFAEGEADLEEKHAVLRHLLAGCQKCQGRLRARWGIARGPAPEGAYDLALDRSRERCLPSLPVLVLA